MGFTGISNISAQGMTTRDHNKMMSKEIGDKYKDSYKHGYDKMKYDKI